MVNLKIITKADIEQAISGKYQKIIDSYPSTGYDLVYQGIRYSPKVVLGIAYLINQGIKVTREEYSKLRESFSSSNDSRKILENFGFQIEKKIRKKDSTINDYENFFDTLKFWIKQTDNNINKENRVKFQEISEDNRNKAEKLFTNPQFNAEFLNYSDFSIRISFFRTGNYKGEKVNFIVFKPDKLNNSWWINIRYNFDSQKVIASYRSDIDKNGDDARFKNYMNELGFGKGISFNVSELNLDSAVANPKVKQLFDYFYEMIQQGRAYKGGDLNMQVQKLVGTLNRNYNIILRGAPGTGKTYLAQQIATDMISEGRTSNIEELTEDESKQLGFVQFHPSYDYTDFVEGLRPTSSGTEVGFELQPGIFKDFCEQAYKPIVNAVDNFEEVWGKFVEKMDEEEEIEVAPGYTYHPSESWESVGGIMRTTNRGHNQYINKGQLYKVYQGLPGVPKGGHDNFRKKVLQYMKNYLGLLDYNAGEGVNKKPYVFIIDEINRGEISKIFGELFFSLDPGYRGSKGSVLTQYSNLHNDKDEKFFIPKNVYIIGTMNDIDRSVDTFDFAMRRRFTFLEITAKQSSDNMLVDENTKSLMTRLNEALVDKNRGGLTSDYEIGASYFLAIEGHGTAREELEPLWNNKLLPLLTDYFRGEHESEKKIKYLENAYFATVGED